MRWGSSTRRSSSIRRSSSSSSTNPSSTCSRHQQHQAQQQAQQQQQAQHQQHQAQQHLAPAAPGAAAAGAAPTPAAPAAPQDAAQDQAWRYQTCDTCTWRRYHIHNCIDQFRQWIPLACDCAPDLKAVYDGLHANPGQTWREIIETGTLSPPSLPVVRSDGTEWSRIPLRVGPECRVMHYGGNHWVYDGTTYSQGDRCVGYHNTRLESLIHPVTAWNDKPIGQGILKDGRLCYGVCTHHGNSGVNVYSDGGLETFHGSQGWVQLEVEVCDTTKLKDGRANRYCVRGTPFETCEKVVLTALWVPMKELPSIVYLS